MKDYVLVIAKRILQLFADNNTATAGSILMPNQVLHAISKLYLKYDEVKAKEYGPWESSSDLIHKALNYLREQEFLSSNEEIIRLTEKGELYISKNL